VPFERADHASCLQPIEVAKKEQLRELAFHVHLGPEAFLDRREDVPATRVEKLFKRVLDRLAGLEELRGPIAFAAKLQKAG